MRNLLDEQRRIVAYLDGFPLTRDLRQARLASLRELQSATGEELLTPTVPARKAAGTPPPMGGRQEGVAIVRAAAVNSR